MRSTPGAWLRRGLLLLTLLAVALPPGPTLADGQRAGAVIVSGASVTAICVPFEETELTGINLLRRAQIALSTQVSAMGEAVCKIQDTGCNYPGQNCFCQCLSAQCAYWSYWYREEGVWVYSGKGGSGRTVRNGGLDAWVWGDGQSSPPPMTWEDVCMAPTPMSLGALQIDSEGQRTPSSERSAPQEAYPGPGATETRADPGSYPGPEVTATTAPSNATIAPGAETTAFPRSTATTRPSITPRPSATPTLAGALPSLPTRPSGMAVRTDTPPAPSTPLPTTAVATSPTATSTAGQPNVGPVVPAGTPTDDTVAARIREGVLRARATAAARNRASDQTPRSSYGYFALLVALMAALIAYAALLRRQRAAARPDQASGQPPIAAPEEPEEPGELPLIASDDEIGHDRG